MENEEQKTMIAKISSKSEQQGQKDGNPWVRYVFKFDDKFTMSTFDVKLKEFNVGDNVEVMYKKSGIYNNILDMRKAEVSQIVTADKIKSQPDSQVWIEKDQRIIRQNCNQRAIETLRLMNEIQPETVKELININNGSLIDVLKSISKIYENIVWKGQEEKTEIKEEII